MFGVEDQVELAETFVGYPSMREYKVGSRGIVESVEPFGWIVVSLENGDRIEVPSRMLTKRG